MKNKIKKLKKYLFLISILFLVSILSHLTIIYLYNDSKEIAVEGGSISEGLVGDFPSLNPLKPLSGNNKYIINLLYKSILKYDTKNKKITSDIANCSIENLLYIECYLEENGKWSTGEEITTDDIIATYKILKNTDTNPIIKKIFSEAETQIKKEKNIITFKNKKADINFLNIFFQPIVKKEVLDEINENNLKGNFSVINGVYSGKYKITNTTRDLTLGITKFILEKNEHYKKNPVLIDKLILKLFPNSNSLLKNKETINIYNDENNIIGESIPRFESKKYRLPQYISLFINKEQIKENKLRQIILNSIKTEEIINILGEENYEKVNNPYINNIKIDKKDSQENVEKSLNILGYYKKEKYINNIEKIKNKYSGETKNEIKTNILEEKSEYIISPNYIKKYNFIKNDNILLKGVTPKNTKEVYINDYKLKGFKENSRYFYYRIKESFDNIKIGENKYEIYFKTDNKKKELYETIKIIYNTNEKKLEEEKNKILDEIKKEKEEKNKVINSNNDKKTEEVLTKIKELKDNFYYNKSLEIFKLDLVYIKNIESIETTTTYIKDKLENIGIKVNLIPISIQEIGNYIGENNKNYDIIISGINLGYFEFNIFHYFHSSQVKNGYNFSKIKKTSLDILLEELKTKILTKNKIEAIEKKVLEFLKEEQVIKTLYTPKINLLIDKNIKNAKIIDKIESKHLRNMIFESSYILDKKIINYENKTIFNFIKYIINKFIGAI